MELKEKLVALRKEKGLTQSAVAEKLDVSRQAISRWESGIALPSTDNLKSLSALYGVPVDYLLNSDTEEQRVTKGLEAENNKFIRMKGNQDPGYENLYVDGDYVTRGRSGLLIHGGRDQTSLWNTEGCVRIFDKDAKKITGLMDSWRSAGYHQFGRIKITRPGQSL